MKTVNVIRLTIGVLTAALVLPRARAADGRVIAENGTADAPACSSCHGAKGEGMAENGYPRLAGLNSGYLLDQLESFADGSRKSDIMSPIATGLSPDERRAVATYYGSQAVDNVPDKYPVDKAELAQGRKIARLGKWSIGLPGCGQCHGPMGEGVGSAFPSLAGQSATYIAAQLSAWKEGNRSNDPDGLMKSVANKLGEPDIAAVAAYYQSLDIARAKGAGAPP